MAEDNLNKFPQLPPPPYKGQTRLVTSSALNTSGEVDSALPQTLRKPSLTSEAVVEARDTYSEIPLSSHKENSELHQGESHWQCARIESNDHLEEKSNGTEDPSSDEDYDIWTLTEEQKQYYTSQFKTLQPDLKSTLSGASARDFFEKSKLPVNELSKIWQLSDIDADGALTLEEFCIAMHLVVLRRNNISLPESLPFSLVNQLMQRINGGCGLAFQSKETDSSVTEQDSDYLGYSPQKEWTKFSSSPDGSQVHTATINPSFQSSVQHADQDPKLVHPVAVRMVSDSEVEKQHIYRAFCREMKSPSTQTHAIQRPTPRKSAPALGAIPPPPQAVLPSKSVSSDTSGGCGLPIPSNVTQSTSQVPTSLSQVPRKEPPPLPPPRSNHGRSYSLDLSGLGSISSRVAATVPPLVPPRVSPSLATPKRVVSSTSKEKYSAAKSKSLDVANFGSDFRLDSALQQMKVYGSSAVNGASACFEDLKSQERLSHRGSLFSIYQPTISNVPRDKREMQAVIQALRKRQMMLSLLHNELNQELSEIMEERIALEIQLEHMKPLSL